MISYRHSRVIGHAHHVTVYQMNVTCGRHNYYSTEHSEDMASCSVSSFKKYFIVLLVWSTYFTVTGDIIVIPRIIEASVGEATELVCTSTVSAIDWHHLRTGAKIHEIVYKDGYVYNGYKRRFSAIDRSSAGGKCTLVIHNVTLADAGTYICMETSEEAVQKPAELIVYEHFPSPQSCVTRVACSPECNNMELSCNMKYSGNMEAVMEWRNFAGELVPSTSFAVNSTTTSTIQLNKHQFQSASYICQMKYSLHNMGSRYNWTHKHQDLLLLNPAQDTENQQVTVFITISAAVTIVSLIAALICAGIIISIRKRNSSRRHSFCKNDPLQSEDMGHELTEQKTSLASNDLDVDEGEIAPRTKGNINKAIYGLSVIDNEIFFITRDSCVVEVFDLITSTYLHAFSVIGLVNPNDMVSCPNRKCLYICDWKRVADDKEIVCVDKDGTIETRWISESKKCRLSITEESHVIVAESGYNAIKEYKPSGQLINKFQTDKEKLHLWHAIKLRNGNFVASFGDIHDSNQEVCLLDNQGKTLHSVSNKNGIHNVYKESNCLFMAVPRTLAIDNDGNIYVADLYNRRILMLTSELHWKGELNVTETGHTVRGPLRICLRDSKAKRQLLVADNMKENGKWKNGRILIMDIKN